MSSKFRFLFVVFYLTVVLILAVSLRNTNNRIFYRLCNINAEHNRLKQQLWRKQLELESVINPAAVSEYFDKD